MDLFTASWEFLVMLLSDPVFVYSFAKYSERGNVMSLEDGFDMVADGLVMVGECEAEELECLNRALKSFRKVVEQTSFACECTILDTYCISILIVGPSGLIDECVEVACIFCLLLKRTMKRSLDLIDGPLANNRSPSAMAYESLVKNANLRDDPGCALHRALIIGQFYDSPGMCMLEMVYGEKNTFCSETYRSPIWKTPGVILSCCMCTFPIMLVKESVS